MASRLRGCSVWRLSSLWSCRVSSCPRRVTTTTECVPSRVSSSPQEHSGKSILSRTKTSLFSRPSPSATSPSLSRRILSSSMESSPTCSLPLTTLLSNTLSWNTLFSKRLKIMALHKTKSLRPRLSSFTRQCRLDTDWCSWVLQWVVKQLLQRHWLMLCPALREKNSMIKFKPPI